MWTEIRPSPECSSPGMGQCSASSAWGLATRRFRAQDYRYAAVALSQATLTANARQTVPSAWCVAPHDSSSRHCRVLYPATNVWIAEVLATACAEAAKCAAQRDERREFERVRGSDDQRALCLRNGWGGDHEPNGALGLDGHPFQQEKLWKMVGAKHALGAQRY
jgi:hypothetical protein